MKRRIKNLTCIIALALCAPALQAASPSVWNGGGSDDNWTTALNWGDNVPVPDVAYDLEFAGSTRLTPANDFANLSDFRNITFASDAGAFRLVGNTIRLNGNIANNSANVQTIANPISLAPGALCNITGQVTSTGQWTNLARLNIGPGAIFRKTTTNFVIGPASGSSGAVLISGGTFTNTMPWGFNNLLVSGIGYGALTMTSGHLDSRGFLVGGVNNVNGVGLATFWGGMVTVDQNVVVPYYSSTAVITIGPDAIFKRISGTGSLNINQNGNGRGELNLLGGVLDNLNSAFGFGTSSSGSGTGGTGIGNLNAGQFTLQRFAASATRGYSFINFNGAKVIASGSRADFLPASFTGVYLNGPFGGYPGGAVIDTANANTIAAALLAPTGNGVSDIPVVDGGSGYIAAPYVSITNNAGGSNATAIAMMVDDGSGNGTFKIGSIKITNPGLDYTADSVGIILKGGAPATPASFGPASVAPNTSGGLAKLGVGMLTLSNNCTFTGPTVVSEGTLMVDGSLGSASSVTVKSGGNLAGSGTIGGQVTVEAGGGISPGNGIGTLALAGDLTTIGGSIFTFEIIDASTGDKLLVGGNLNPAATTQISIPGATPLANGDYTLMEVTGTLGGSAANFAATSPTITKTYAVVYVPGSPNKVVLRVSENASLLAWTGNAGAIWSADSSLNWQNQGGTPVAFQNNLPVIFNNQGAAHPSVNISSVVSPAEVGVNADVDYSFGGAGSIAGTGKLAKGGTAALTLANANTFSGGVDLNSGTLNLNHASAPGTGGLRIFGGTIDNTSGSPVTLANNNVQDWEGDFIFNGTSDLNMGTGAVSLPASRNLTVNNRTLAVGGDISGLGSITKAGAGTLVLAGKNTYTGGTTNTQGNLTITGVLSNTAGLLTLEGGVTAIGGAVDTGSGAWVLGNSGRGVLNLVPGASVFKNGYFRFGLNAGSAGAFNVSGGNFTNLWAWSFYNFAVGVSGYGSFAMSGGYVDTRGFLVAAGNSTDSMGMVNLSGGTVVINQAISMPYYGGTAVMNVATNASLLRVEGVHGLNINLKGNGKGELNLIGGTIENGLSQVTFGTGPSPSTGGSGILNLNSGMLATVALTNYMGESRLNFNGATLKATTNHTAAFLQGTMTSIYVNGPFGGFSGGAVLDSAGFTNTISASLQPPTGEGLRTIAVADGGMGYMGPPYVWIMDPSGGVGATAIANMVDDGSGGGTFKVASFRVTNPGVNYTAATTVVMLMGGAPLSPASAGAVTSAPNTSGGLTKTGEGTFVLSGANAYTGPTIVNAGLLAIDGSLAAQSAVTVKAGALGGNGLISGPVTVESAGTLSPGTSIGTLTVDNTLTLQAGSTTYLEVDKAAGTNDLVKASAINYGGKLVVNNLDGALVTGDTFKLFETAAPNGNFSQIAVSGGTATFSPATGVLTITSTMADYPTNVSYTFGNGQLTLAWPETHKGWYMQSNSVSVADELKWFNVPGSESVTSLIIPMATSESQVFYRLSKP